MRLATILDPGCIVPDVGSGSREEVLARLAAPLAAGRDDLDADQLLERLLARERESSTAIADGIAIPHARPEAPGPVTAALGRSPAGADFESLDGQPTRLFVVLVSPLPDPDAHGRWLAHVARVLSDRATRERLLAATDAAGMLRVLSGREDELEREAGSQAKAAS